MLCGTGALSLYNSFSNEGSFWTALAAGAASTGLMLYQLNREAAFTRANEGREPSITPCIDCSEPCPLANMMRYQIASKQTRILAHEYLENADPTAIPEKGKQGKEFRLGRYIRSLNLISYRDGETGIKCDMRQP